MSETRGGQGFNNNTLIGSRFVPDHNAKAFLIFTSVYDVRGLRRGHAL